MIELHIELTNKCMLKCKHCSSEANSIFGEGVFCQKKIIDFINKLESDNLKIVFTGGEPMLFGIDELSNLFKSIKQLNQKITIGLFTTGVLGTKDDLCRFINELEIKKLKEAGLSFVYFTMFSRTKKIHEFITNEATYDLTLHTINQFIKHKIKTNLNYVLSKFSSIKEVIADIKFFKQRGIEEVRILRLIKHGRAVENWNEIGISDSIQLNIIRDLMYFHFDNVSIGGMPQLSSCQGFNDNKCYAGIRKFYIDILGDIYPCACVKKNPKYKLGNIYSKYEFKKNLIPREQCLALE